MHLQHKQLLHVHEFIAERGLRSIFVLQGSQVASSPQKVKGTKRMNTMLTIMLISTMLTFLLKYLLSESADRKRADSQ